MKKKTIVLGRSTMVIGRSAMVLGRSTMVQGRSTRYHDYGARTQYPTIADMYVLVVFPGFSLVRLI